MEDEENVVWSASQVVASHVEFYFEVNIFVALILLLVDPIDDVQMAMTHRFRYALDSDPSARRVLRASPFQNVQVPSLRRIHTSVYIPVSYTHLTLPTKRIV